MIEALLAALLDAVFPPRCPACRSFADKNGAWCPECLAQTISARKLAPSRFRHLDEAYALCRYQGVVRRMIASIKYDKNFAYLPHLETLLKSAGDVVPLSQFDFAVPVPLYAEKQKKRGFNQTEKIFAPWAAREKIAWVDAMERVRDTAPQYALGIARRRENVKGAFKMKAAADFRGKNILLADDIFTTGSTMEECAGALKNSGAAKVVGLALASDA